MVVVKEQLLDTQESMIFHHWLDMRQVLGTPHFPWTLLASKVMSRVSHVLQEA